MLPPQKYVYLLVVVFFKYYLLISSIMADSRFQSKTQKACSFFIESKEAILEREAPCNLHRYMFISLAGFFLNATCFFVNNS